MDRRIVFGVLLGLFLLAPFGVYAYDWSQYSTDQLIQQRREIDDVLRSRMDRMTPRERDELTQRGAVLTEPFQSPRREIDPDTTFENEWQRRVQKLSPQEQPQYIMPPSMESPRKDTTPQAR